eukprot:TRINITY_DN92244_c0_g1_i1.p1 TRINITY_DN92244_c0_g1~~TRINITY_DN92244_c0_g1_i1.p1  ORF type:complete len:651 (+),score=114.73 TRINITY_DN92244_c0_g1_i1:23-1954(+)
MGHGHGLVAGPGALVPPAEPVSRAACTLTSCASRPFERQRASDVRRRRRSAAAFDPSWHLCIASLGLAVSRRQRTARRASEVEDLAIESRDSQAPAASEAPNLELAFAKAAQDNLLKVGKEHKHGMTFWNDLRWDYWDLARIFVKGGNGGNGCKSFHREMNMPLMGPDGGDGGKGGHVYLRCTQMTNTLNGLKERTHYYAKSGEVGRGCELGGKHGDDLYVNVPPGTICYVQQKWVPGIEGSRKSLPGEKMLIRTEEITERQLVGELTRPGQVLRVARGGRPGKGNKSFKSHTNTAPWIATNGEKGIGRWIELELKITADIGLIGVPNAGKSSLLMAVTDKAPKIAAYPFTTTVPNLGFYRADVHGGVTLCDVPGLIDGAHEGRGMGITFLRHVERCRTLIHVISGDSEDPIGDFESIQQELRQYSTEVANKPQVVVVNKTDIPEVQEVLPELMAELRRRCGHSRVFDISAATRYNTSNLMKRVYKWHKSHVLRDWKAAGLPCEDAEHIIGSREMAQLGTHIGEVSRGERIQLDEELPVGRRRKSQFQAKIEWDVIEEAWRLIHPEVERAAALTNWNYEEGGFSRLNDICKATGMTEALRAANIKDGESIIVATKKFSYNPTMDGQDSRLLIYEMDLEPETLR